MIYRKAALECFLQVLNSAYEADPAAMHALVCNRVPCNQALADHPTVVAVTNKVAMGESYTVGMIGIINGICAAITGERVAVQFSDTPDEDGCSKIVGFISIPIIEAEHDKIN